MEIITLSPHGKSLGWHKNGNPRWEEEWENGNLRWEVEYKNNKLLKKVRRK